MSTYIYSNSFLNMLKQMCFILTDVIRFHSDIMYKKLQVKIGRRWPQTAISIIWASAWDFQQCGMCHQQSLRSACAYAQSDQSLCWSLEYSMDIKLLTEHHLEFLSLKRGCTGSSESTHVKTPHCWKSHVTANIIIFNWNSDRMISFFPSNRLAF